MNRDPFAPFLVKRFTYWGVYIYENDQVRIGRLVVWCLRDDALELTDATQEELAELIEILRALRKATTALWGASWFNYSFLGNADRHLHCHFVPRYDKPVVFEGETFTDPNYGKNSFSTQELPASSPEMLEKIRAALSKVL